MKIGIATLGSRGDVQPFLALAVALARRGHTVRLATNEPFQGFVEAGGIEFYPLGGDIKHIVGDRGRAALLAAEGRPLASLRALREHVGPLVREGLSRMGDALAGCDVVMGQLLAPGAVHYAERHDLPYFDVAYDPIAPTWEFAHPGAPPSLGRGLASRLSYFAAEQVFWQAFRPDLARYRREVLGLEPTSLLGPTGLRSRNRRPALIGFSGVLVPRPRDWPEDVLTTGPWLLQSDPPAPDEAARISRFLEAGSRPVYIGFGSMTVPRPDVMTDICVTALRKANRRAIISAGWGGAARRADSSDVLFVDDVPHAWLFPKMAAIVHHGGQGTTAEATRAGVPQLVVPFLADQPFWGHRVWKAGIGPEPILISALGADNLARALEVMSLPDMVARAAAAGARAREEPGADRAAVLIERSLTRRESHSSGLSSRPTAL
ncbi:MAG: glycosyltransferase [Polyangiaceae bacterium]